MQKPFVLIVEDERDIAALFRHIMDLAGYRTEIAADATLALERLAHCHPDVVLLDLSLPHISGAQVLNRMRRDERLHDIPVVVITAYSEMTKELDVEPDLVMLKPVSAAQLIGLVGRLTRELKRVETAPLTDTPWDVPTGLYNRSFFVHRIDSAIKSMQENGQSLFAVLALYPNRPEAASPQASARLTDNYLRSLGRALKATVRPTDTLARLGAERFGILIEQAPGLRIPDMIAARIQQRLKEPPPDATITPLDCAIGVLLCDSRYDDALAILRDAESALDRAQASGPGACLTFDHDSIQTLSA